MADNDNGLLIENGGAVYYIPESDLANYRVPEETAAQVVAAMEDTLESEVSGFGNYDMLKSDSLKIRPDVKPLRAFEGKFGSPGTTQLSNEDTAILR